MNDSRTNTTKLKRVKYALTCLLIVIFIGSLCFDLGSYLPYLILLLAGLTLFDYFLIFLPIEKEIIAKEDDLKRQNNKLKTANAELEEITRGMVHDLKRPLRAMGSFAQLARRRLPSHAGEDIKEYMDYITNSASRMSELLNAIVNFSQINSKEYMKNKVYMDELMDEVKLNILDVINQKGASIYCYNMPVLTANRFQLMQVMQNLLENAIKYNEHPCPEVEIRGEEKEDHYVISVRDNGIGIEEDYKEKVFQLFKRLNPHIYEGTGVGLATCKKIVENHHGDIWLESEEGVGTTFFFTLPKTKTLDIATVKGSINPKERLKAS